MADDRRIYVVGDVPRVYHTKRDCLSLSSRVVREARLHANGTITVGPWWNRHTFRCAPCAACVKDDEQS